MSFAGQVLQLTAPKSEVAPAGQQRHPVAPDLGWKKPRGQVRHCSRPDMRREYDPGAHLSQRFVDALRSVPLTHTHDEAEEEGTEREGQDMQRDAPADVDTLPRGQSLHTEPLSSGWKVPAGQRSHLPRRRMEPLPQVCASDAGRRKRKRRRRRGRRERRGVGVVMVV